MPGPRRKANETHRSRSGQFAGGNRFLSGDKNPARYWFLQGAVSSRRVVSQHLWPHGAEAESLEEWFDPVRLGPDYLPHGFSWGRDQKDDPGV